MKLWGYHSQELHEQHLFVDDGSGIGLEGFFSDSEISKRGLISDTIRVVGPFGTFVIDYKHKDEVANHLVKLAQKLRELK